MQLVPLLFMALTTTALAQDPFAPPGTALDGQSPESLAASWWQWAASAPEELSPVRDRTGTHCAVGQKGEAWFLAGGYGSSNIRRACAVPKGRHLFFPVINMVYWPAEEGTGYPCERARRSAALNNDGAIDLFVELDGKALPDPKRYRVTTTQCFDIFARAREVAPAPVGFPAATDGYWVILKPLSPGKHVLKFGGRYNRESGAYGRMVQDIEYELEVR